MHRSSLLQKSLMADSPVIPAQAGTQNAVISQRTGFPITTSGMTKWGFCKRHRLVRSFLVLLVFPVLLAAFGVASADESPLAPPLLTQLINSALTDNPELQGDQARWDIFLHKARQAGSLDDPMLMLRFQNLLIRDPLAFDRDSTSAKIIGVTQMVPFYGKRGLVKEAAAREAEAAGWELAERKLELAGMVKESWSQLLFIDSSLEIVASNIAVLDDLSRYSESMYGVGQGQQQDVLKAQLERTKMEEMRISLVQKRRSLVATLNTLAFRPADSPIVPDTILDLTPIASTADELENLATANRPLFKAIAARAQKAQAMRKLAERELYPDFTFSFEYMQRDTSEMDSDGYDMYSTGVTFNLPLQHERRRAMIAEGEADGRMAVAELAMAQNRIRLSIADALARMAGSSSLAKLYREGIIPQAKQTLAATLSAYQAGKTDFMKVLDSRMTVFNFEREYQDAVAEHQMQLARLEAVVGTKLPTAGKP